MPATRRGCGRRSRWPRSTASASARTRAFRTFGGSGAARSPATPDEIRDDLIYQIGALTAFTRRKRLQHVKPHGALYNMAVDREDVARAIGEAVLAVDPRPDSRRARGFAVGARGARAWACASRARCLPTAPSTRDGTLVPRSEPGAVIHDPAAVVERSLRLVTRTPVTAITGETVELDADTICLHGDTPGAVRLAAALRKAFVSRGRRTRADGARLASLTHAAGPAPPAGRRPRARRRVRRQHRRGTQRARVRLLRGRCSTGRARPASSRPCRPTAR